MSSDDTEIIPPNSHLPAAREMSTPAAQNDGPLRPPGGVLSTVLTAFQARLQAHAFGDIAANIRAQTAAIEAETERRKSALKLRRTVHELDELDEILALDRAERQAQRATIYGELEASRAKISDDNDERAHQRRLAQLRRQREIEEANARLVEAKRGTFTASEGLESQERLKQLNLEMWEKRAATEQLDAEKIWLLLQREVDGIKSPSKKADDGSLEQLAEMRASLVQRAQEFAAGGDASKAERYERLAAELDELVVAALRGSAQK